MSLLSKPGFVKRITPYWLAISLIFFAVAAQAAPPRLSVVQAAERLAAGGYILLMRHSATEPGTGDPAGFDLARCETQRNLSESGRQHAVKLGQAFKAAAITIAEVRHSQWCRCRDTAELAFGQSVAMPALNSTFAGQGDPVAQMSRLREQAAALPAGQNYLWVTHQVIASAATGRWTSPGEILVTRYTDQQFRVLFRIQTDD